MKSGISWNEVQELFSSVRYVSIATVDKHDIRP